MNKTITHDDLTITLRTATVLDGMRRGELLGQAFEHPNSDTLVQTAAIVFYPPCVACSDWKGTLDEFMALPETLVDEWLAAAYELNPHWQQKPEPDADQEKKES
jgi:hypothetical protein